jgi:GNAT superfamily N-acetyltransferase
MRFVYTNGENADFAALCEKLDVFLDEAAGGAEKRTQYVQYNLRDKIHDVVVMYDGDIPIGCAAFKQYDSSTAEIKRVFITESYRGKGYSKTLLAVLEEKAKNKGFTKLILETGEVLTAAKGLYRSIGYKIIPNYGQYADMPTSICMEKII